MSDKKPTDLKEQKFNLISKEELKQMFIDIDAPIEFQLYFIQLTEEYISAKNNVEFLEKTLDSISFSY